MKLLNTEIKLKEIEIPMMHSDFKKGRSPRFNYKVQANVYDNVSVVGQKLRFVFVIDGELFSFIRLYGYNLGEKEYWIETHHTFPKKPKSVKIYSY